MSKTQIAVAAMIGGVVGLGLFTFRYAEGLSYFSTDPKACANCHIMNEQYASWSKGPHHGAATCVDCHLPHDFVAKYWPRRRTATTTRRDSPWKTSTSPS